MTFPDHLQISRRRLKIIRQGFTGVYVPVECSCSIHDFAPCCNDWSVIRNCKPGYWHVDPRPGKINAFACGSSEPPTAEAFDEFENEWKA